MKAIDAARLVNTTRTCHLVRERKGEPSEYDAKPFTSGSKRGWFYLDGFTASAIVQVHDGLGEVNRAKFSALPLERMSGLAFKIIAKSAGVA